MYFLNPLAGYCHTKVVFRDMAVFFSLVKVFDSKLTEILIRMMRFLQVTLNCYISLF